VVAPPAAPEKPSFLTGPASEKWDELVAQLTEVGVLSEIDGPMLAVYCTIYEEFVEAVKTLATEGRYITCRGGFKVAHPAFKVKVAAGKLLAQIGALFGLSPHARQNLRVPPRQQKDELADFLAGGGSPTLPMTAAPAPASKPGPEDHRYERPTPPAYSSEDRPS
jgi:P27 family predicted phage terminase small subunit